MEKRAVLLAAIAGLGAWISQHLIGIHIESALGGGDSGICAANAEFSCNAVATSQFSRLFGVPIAVLGQAFYFVVMAAMVICVLRSSPPRGLWDGLLLAAVGAVGYSVILAAISTFGIGKLCPWCIALYLTNASLLGGIWLGHPDGGHVALSRLRTLPSSPGFWILTAFMGAGVFASQSLYAGQHELRASAIERSQANADAPGPASTSTPAAAELELGDAVARGSAEAPVVIVEFSDFQCPHCSRFAKVLKEAQSDSKGAFRYYFKHWPMDQACNPAITRPFHEHACNAALAAHCAGEQDQFWAMHDLLFDNQSDLEDGDLRDYADQLNLNVAEFERCMGAPESLEQIRADVAEGAALGVSGTPNFFINGERVKGGRSLPDLIKMVEAAKP